MAIGDIITGLGDNPYFGAGFGLIGIGSALAVLRKSAQYGNILFRRQCLMSLEINSRDKSYSWVLNWINKKSSHKTQHISVETIYQQNISGHINAHFTYVPGIGDHFLRFGGKWVKIERNRELQAVTTGQALPFETVTLTTYGWDRGFFTNLMTQAYDAALREVEGYTVRYVSRGHEWREFGHPVRKRPLSSVVLDDGVTDTIHQDVTNFMQSAQWYIDRGIPYRRGYLLHGPPGCGKTSFIQALAGQLDCSISMLSVSEPTMTDDRLMHLLNVAPLQSIILLEDVDAAFVSRHLDERGLTHVTFSGLLNALDGVACSEGRIMFMTTNYVERLDAALIRPGRVDLKHYIGFCTDYQLVNLFIKFFPNASQSLAQQFASSFRKHAQGEEISAAQVQGFLLMHKTDEHEAVRLLNQN